jgi:ATP-dependent Lon protease
MYNIRNKKRKLNYCIDADSDSDSDDSEFICELESGSESESESSDSELEPELNTPKKSKQLPFDTDYNFEEEKSLEDETELNIGEDFIKDLTEKLLEEARKIVEEEEEKNDTDNYDIDFIKLSKSNMLDLDNDLIYFKSLDKNQKKNYIDKINILNKNTIQEIPFKFTVLDSDMDNYNKSIVMSNLNTLNELENNSGEYSKLKNWMDGVMKIPFNKYSKLPIENINSTAHKKDFLINSYNILNESVYGHKKAKGFILQQLSKWIQNSNSSGNILALQGPMGNGKTTLVKEGISKAINRPFAFISLGGSSDSSFLNGHGYTYEGSTWGRIVDILMKSKCMNPIIYFDELDKVSETSKGDEIIHLLTHITDMSQNSVYQDNYFPGINLDLSRVLFIFSFNDEFKIDKILKDRMNVINTSGFNENEKLEISKKYLLRDLYISYNIKDTDIIFTDDIIQIIIKNYTGKECGVRNLKRCFDSIISKLNMFSILYNDIQSISISISWLSLN